jgi:hypothetical protein
MAPDEDPRPEPVLVPENTPLGPHQRRVGGREIALRDRRRVALAIGMVLALILAMVYFMRQPDIAPAGPVPEMPHHP